MWWNKPYVNRRDWILENLGVLDLTSDQIVVLLMIDYLNVNNIAIDPKVLSDRTNIAMDKIDSILHNLVRQNILQIKAEKDRIEFDIGNLFEEGLRYEYVDENIFEVFESELARPLSQMELERLNSWLREYTQEEIVSALRTAIVYQKVSFPYINSILANNRKEKGMQL